MAGSRILTTEDIHVVVTTKSQKLYIESENAIASQTIRVNAESTGIISAIEPGDVMISFGDVVTEFPPTVYKAPVEFDTLVGRGRETFIDTWSGTISGFPMKPSDVILTFTVTARRGGSLVVDTLGDGTLIGDIDLATSTLNWTTGATSFKFTEDIANREPIRIRIRYPGTTRPETSLTLPGNPYTGDNTFRFQLGRREEMPVYIKPGAFIVKGTIRIAGLDADGNWLRVIDDGQGHLVGDIEAITPVPTNYINYATGEGLVTFSKPIKDVEEVKASYGIYSDVHVFKNFPKKEKVTVALRFEDLQRIIKAAELTMNSEQAAMQFNV